MKLLKIFSLIMAFLLMTSCNEDDEQAQGFGDVMIVSKKSGPETVYGISIFAYSLRDITGVSVVSSAESGKTYNLTSSGGNFSYETPDSLYSTTKPVASTYNFTATLENGSTETFENKLTDQALPIPTFEKCEYNEPYHQLEINWPLLNGATSYAVNILDNNKIVFRSSELKYISKGAYAVRATGSGWDTNFIPVAGKTYTVRLFAYMYEASSGPVSIQAISIGETSAAWGN